MVDQSGIDWGFYMQAMGLKIHEDRLDTIIFTGKRGGGKTSSMVYLAHEGFKQGFPVYSNFKLGFEHTLIKYTDFGEVVPDDEVKKVIVIDDMAEGTKGSVHERELGRTLTLARKIVTQNACFLFSTPLLDQLPKKVIQFSNIHAEPSRIYSYPDTGLPAFCLVNFFLKKPNSDTQFLDNPLELPLPIGEILNYFDTGEAPPTLRSGNYNQAFKLFARHRHKSLSVLSQMIQNKMGLPKSTALDFARSIKDGFNPEIEIKQDELISWGAGE